MRLIFKILITASLSPLHSVKASDPSIADLIKKITELTNILTKLDNKCMNITQESVDILNDQIPLGIAQASAISAEWAHSNDIATNIVDTWTSIPWIVATVICCSTTGWFTIKSLNWISKRWSKKKSTPQTTSHYENADSPLLSAEGRVN